MTDTAESVRKLASIFDSEGCDAEANILRRYAALLERIGKAPKARIKSDGIIHWSLDRSLAGQRVALLQAEE